MTTGYRGTNACLEDVAASVLNSGDYDDRRLSVVVISKIAEVF